MARRRDDARSHPGKSRALVALLAALAAAAPAGAESLEALVQSGGEPVEDAVVYAVRVDANGKPIPPAEPTEIDQVDKEYVPYVTAVRAGTRVLFPNHDQIRHHVYSLSDAKRFEIPLYKGMPAKPIVFDKPGVVTLGCNIHDWMAAYVLVLETPHFAVTPESGRVTLADLPPGDYSLRVWHPQMKGEPESNSRTVSVPGNGTGPVAFAIEQKTVWRPRRAPSAGAGGGYR